MINNFSRARDGNTQLTPNFRVSEFASRCGADKILIDERLPQVLQTIRNLLGDRPLVINSGFRTAEHNRNISTAAEDAEMPDNDKADAETENNPPAAPNPPADPPQPSEDFVMERELFASRALMSGDDVKAVQVALSRHELHVGSDLAQGIYGARTALAVRHFQARKGLIVDGIVGKFTATALGLTWESD